MWFSPPRELNVVLVEVPTYRKRDLKITQEVARPSGDDLAAKHDVLLAEQADGAEGAVKVMVINMGRYAVIYIIHIHNSRNLLGLGFVPGCVTVSFVLKRYQMCQTVV